MNIVKIEGYACGGYSESEWIEEIYLLEEDYDKIKEFISDMEITISDLDGKHSQTDADIEIEVINEDRLSMYSWDKQYDGCALVETIGHKLRDTSFDIDMLRENADKVLQNVDNLVNVDIQVNKSKLESLHKCLDELGINY